MMVPMKGITCNFELQFYACRLIELGLEIQYMKVNLTGLLLGSTILFQTILCPLKLCKSGQLKPFLLNND